MELRERIYSVLIVSSAEKSRSSIAQLLKEGRYEPVMSASDSGDAKRMMARRDFDIVIINTPLTDEFGTKLASEICQKSGTGVMILVKAEHYEYICDKVTPFGALVLSKPLSAQILNQSLMLLCGTRERLRQMERKTASVEEKMEEIRIVNHAKWTLIAELKMTEEEAHRYIEKKAMDQCISKRKVAESIIQTYK